jgi:hypothetical protein
VRKREGECIEKKRGREIYGGEYRYGSACSEVKRVRGAQRGE